MHFKASWSFEISPIFEVVVQEITDYSRRIVFTISFLVVCPLGLSHLIEAKVILKFSSTQSVTMMVVTDHNACDVYVCTLWFVNDRSRKTDGHIKYAEKESNNAQHLK